MAITAADLDRRSVLQKELQAMAAKAKPLKDELEGIEKRATEALFLSGRATTRRGGWTLSFIEKAKGISWKTLALAWQPAGEKIPEPGTARKLVITKA